VKQAVALGPLSSVVHTAGLSPQMADPDVILKVNALGTIHIAEAFHKVATDGFTLVNIASMSAHMLPGWIIPTRAFRYAFSDPQRLLKKVGFRCNLLPNAFARRGMAYAISKSFVVWYTKRSAAKFRQKNARIVSISPGTIDTEMGRLEEKSGSIKIMQEKAALKRLGKPEEIAQLAEFCVSDQAAYITGIDILCDGGVIASQTR
jgi:NAD(P)-dependent dehydrogenase (short-subunit alcohol dehydrogenase family)